MKKFNLLLCIMLFFSLTSVWADPGILPIATGTEGYPEKARTNFTIKAYKKTPDPVIMSIYDAFSRNLDEVIQDSEIDVYPKMAFFLTDDFANLQDPHKRVIFSFLISGQSTGTFTLDITITPFKGPCTLKNNKWEDGANIVDSHFQFVDYDVAFQRGGKVLTDKKYKIAKDDTATIETATATDAGNAALKAKWQVSYTGSSTAEGTTAIGEYWHAEGSVAMAIKKSGTNGYDSTQTQAGRYQAKVTIKMTVV